MKKRTEKKLMLNRETLQTLQEASLHKAAGAFTGASICVLVCVYPTNANISACKKCNA